MLRYTSLNDELNNFNFHTDQRDTGHWHESKHGYEVKTGLSLKHGGQI